MAEHRRRSSDQELATPQASRLTKPSWRDGRLVAGIFLILASTIGGAAALNHFDNSTEVLQATHALVPGQKLQAGDVRSVKVRLDSSSAKYVSGKSALPEGQVVREVRSGELLPSSAVATNAQLAVRTVALPVDPAQSSTLVAGSVVDVWIARHTSGSTATLAFDAPKRVVEHATVARVPQPSGGLGVSASDQAVHVLIPDDSVADVIDAINGGAKVNLVPVAGSPLRGNS